MSVMIAVIVVEQREFGFSICRLRVVGVLGMVEEVIDGYLVWRVKFRELLDDAL